MIPTNETIKKALINFIQKFLKYKTKNMSIQFENDIFRELQLTFQGIDLLVTKKSSEYKRYINPYKENTLLLAKHPEGENKYPDFRIKFNNIELDIEAKSSKDGTIHWNSTMVKSDAIYIYNHINVSNGKNSILLFHGKDYRELKNKDFEDTIDSHITTVEKLTTSFKDTLNKNPSKIYLDSRNITYYIRENWKSSANLLQKSNEYYAQKVKQYISTLFK